MIPVTNANIKYLIIRENYFRRYINIKTTENKDLSFDSKDAKLYKSKMVEPFFSKQKRKEI